MRYDEARMRDALVYSGVPREGLEGYLKSVSNAEIFYKYPTSIGGYLDYDDLAVDVLSSKYLGPKEIGPVYIWDRLARAMTSVEKSENQEHWYKEFFSILKDFKFVPGGRVMHGGGRTEVKREPTLSNCYVIPIDWTYSSDEIANLPQKIRTRVSNIVMDASRDGKTYGDTFSRLEKLLPKDEISKFLFPADSLEGIYQNLREAAFVYRTGGGVGTDLSVLRPEGSYVNSTMNHAPGVTAFMDLLSESTETVAQEGRRGALMLTLRVSHPDIEKFITIKNDPKRKKVEHANISVLITDDFMKAVETDAGYTLYWQNEDSSNEKLSRFEKKVNARDLWFKIIKNAHVSAEPGIIFWDTMKAYHNVEYANPLSSTNPCGEQPLAKYTACNLGNINLAAFVDNDGDFNFSELEKTVKSATRFMDNIIPYNLPNHAFSKIRKAVSEDRRIGLGVTALGDSLVKMKIKYDSEKGVEIVEKIMRTIRDTAYETSIELAVEKGVFPLFNWKGYSQSKFVQSLPKEIQNKIEKNGIRNGTVLTVPPVGTGSIVVQSSSGIEPIFSVKSRRKVKKPSGSGGETTEYKVMHPLIRKLFGTDENLPDYVVTAHNIDPYFRIKMQKVIQKYVDSAISSTINLPEDVSVEIVADIYMQAWKQGLKGVTVYREGSRDGILQTEGFANKKNGRLENLVEVERPMTVDERKSSATYGIGTGDGKLHITITGDERKYPLEVFANLGPIGSGRSTSTLVDGLRLSRYLQEAQEPDLIQIFKDYGSAKSDNPVGFGPNRVDSIQHGFSIIWKYHLLRYGIIKQDENQVLEQIVFKNGKTNNSNGNHKSKIIPTNQGPPCGECGSRNTIMASGCREPVCHDCGSAKCG